ncbi:hypothetical protein DSL72_006172 [Monilinia vaccinii-corymbosi]|uniref:HORMA domain-containing protein n=1 Tax=Monilinia vaccinii-corymbosi TaxID=61207 RepID=A0A8A3PH67_9HELO|nr:hypothetical protein DSL72_006172 [Monilinia vaccinii-corymbosi]
MPPRPPPLSTPHSLHTHLLAFLTLSIHTILHARGLYPSNSFLLTRAFNFPVPQNRHPQLCAYINSCISAITPHLQAGTIDSLSIVIYSDTPLGGEIQILERYMFSLSRFPSIPISERFTEFEFRAAGDPNEVKNIDVEEELRATLRKLAYSAGKLEGLKDPEDCTWGVVMEMKEDIEGEGNAPIGHPQPFEPALAELQIPSARANLDVKGKGKAKKSDAEIMANSRVGRARGGVKSTAIRAVEVGEFIMEAWIEEGKAKFENQDSQEEHDEYKG